MLKINTSGFKIIKCLTEFTKISTNTLRLKNVHRSAGLWRLCRREQSTVPERRPLNVLFFGSDDFSLESLRSLYNEFMLKKINRLEIISAYKGEENILSKYAKQSGIPISVWPIDDKLLNFDVGVVVSFGHLIPANIIQSFPLGIINVHGSLLPRWRGSAPIIHALINGDTQTGISIMKIKPDKFDVGDILVQECTDIGEHETMPELRIRLAKIGANLLIDTLNKLPEILSTAKPQSSDGITYAPKATPQLAFIKWDEMTAKNVYDLQRALSGLYPLMTKYKNMRIKLCDVIQTKAPVDLDEHTVPGLVKFNNKDKELVIKCKDDTWLSVRKVIISGRRPLTALEFSNGFIKGQKLTSIIFES